MKQKQIFCYVSVYRFIETIFIFYSPIHTFTFQNFGQFLYLIIVPNNKHVFTLCIFTLPHNEYKIVGTIKTNRNQYLSI